MQHQPVLCHDGSSPRRRSPKGLATQRPPVSPNFALPNQNPESSASKPHRECHRPRGGDIGAETSLQPRPNRDPTAPNSAPLFLTDHPCIAATPVDAPQIEAGKGASAGRPPIVGHQQHHSASRLVIRAPHGKDLSSNRLSSINANQRICHRILLLAFALPLEHILRTHTV